MMPRISMVDDGQRYATSPRLGQYLKVSTNVKKQVTIRVRVGKLD
ncbi:MAG TPA: hypothetical protein V6D19_02085 [Stenomitos sp.]